MLNITTQAYVYTITLLITAVIDTIVFTVLYGLTGFFTAVILLLLTLPIVILSIYNIDCLSTGSCDMWAWVLSILSCIYLLVTTLLMIAAATIKEKDDDKEKKKE
jgi:hypothetical protein